MMSRRRALLAVVVLLVLAAPVWLALRSWATTRTIRFDLTPGRSEPSWSLQYRDAKTGRENGLWLPLEHATTPELVEVEVLGPGANGKGAPGAPITVFLYTIRSVETGARMDLKKLLGTGAASPGWSDFKEGEGIVYYSAEPGKLRLQATGPIELLLAKTPSSGIIKLTYAGNEKTIDLSAPQDERLSLVLKRERPAPEATYVVKERLPNGNIGGLELRYTAAPGGFGVARVKYPWIEMRVFGMGVLKQELNLIRETGSSKNQIEVPVVPSESGGASFDSVPSLPLVGHLLGWTTFSLGFILLAAFVRGARLIARAGRPRWLMPEVPAIAATVIARVWLCCWAPTMYCGDSMDYMRGAINFAETGKVGIESGWRMFGVSYVFGALWKIFGAQNFNAALGIMHAIVGILTAVLAGRIARRVMPRAWAAWVIALVGLSPVLLMWERFAMSETISAFMVAACVWGALRLAGVEVMESRPLQPGLPPRGEGEEARFTLSPSEGRPGCGGENPGMAAMLIGSVILGVTIALAPFVRSNLLLLFAFIPLLVLVAGSRRRGFARAALSAVIVGVVATACITPRVLENRQTYGKAAFVVGSGFARGVFAWANGIMDPNQTRAFDESPARELRQGRRTIGDYEFADRVKYRSRLERDPRVHEWTETDRQLEELTSESIARRSDKRVAAGLSALANILGLWNRVGSGGFEENDLWTRPLRGEPNGYGDNFFVPPARDMKPPPDRTLLALFDAARAPTTELRGTVNSAILDDWFRTDRLLRPVLAFLLLLGSLAGLLRLDRIPLMLGLMVGAHAFALAFIVLTGIDRYSVTFEALLRIVAVYGVWRVREWWGRRGSASHF